jgi:hypothetical protein
MSFRVFNACLLAGWLLVAIGAGLWWLPAGFIAGGVLLIGLNLLVARMVGVNA